MIIIILILRGEMAKTLQRDSVKLIKKGENKVNQKESKNILTISYNKKCSLNILKEEINLVTET